MPADGGRQDVFALDQDEAALLVDDPNGDDGKDRSHAAVTPHLRNLHGQVETALFSNEGPKKRSLESEGRLHVTHNIVGVGIGSAEKDTEQIGDDGPGTPVLNIYVSEPATMEDVKRTAVDHLGVGELSKDDRQVNVIYTGHIEPLAYDQRERPSPNGISIGQEDVKAGTQSILARGCSGQRSNQVLILSNNHILADLNNAGKGDPILQPGPYDGGQTPRDKIAELERFVRLHFDGRPNFVDCATALTQKSMVRNEFVYRSGNQTRYFSVNDQWISPQIGMQVGKNGRTTELTSGRITDVNASFSMNYSGGGTAFFRDQITIKGNHGKFSDRGDSGSLVWTWDKMRSPVGLLFASGNGCTFANKINRVLSALDITFDMSVAPATS